MAAVETVKAAGAAKHAERKGKGAEQPETRSVTLETDFRGDVRSLSWDSVEEFSLRSRAEFARAIAGAYELPPAWSATLITYTSPAGERCVLLTDEHLKQVVQLGQESAQAGKLLRIRIERVGVALTESMQSVPRSSQKKRMSPKGAQRARLGGLPTYTNRNGERVVMHQSVQSVANNVNSNLQAWTSLRPGTDAWLNWQRNVKKTLTDTPELQQHAKYIVPPRAQKGDHAYILLPSAGCFFHFPFVSDGRRYALLGRPRCVSGTAEQQVPPELLAILKKLAPEVCTPENEEAARRRQEAKDKDRAEYMAKVSSNGQGQAQTKEEILARRQELMAKEQERQAKDWCQQVQAMRSHTSFSTLLPGGSMIAAMDVTLLVVDDAQCLLASRQRVDSPSEHEVKTLTDVRALLADITVVSAFDVLATMQLQADNERALARQQALILEIEEENELKTALKTTKQAKNRKKKNRKQQKSTRSATETPASAADGRSAADSAPSVRVSSESDDDQFRQKVPSENLSESTDGTDDGLTQELEQAIAIANDEELLVSSAANDGWTVVAPPRAKPVSAKPQKKNKKQQARRAKGAATKQGPTGTDIDASQDTAEQMSTREGRSPPSTPERETAPPGASVDSPAAPKPSSPVTSEHQPVNIGEMEWPQLAPMGGPVAKESSLVPLQQRRQQQTEAAVNAENDQSAKVAAQQIEHMMKGLANEDEAIPEAVSQEPSLQPTDLVGDSTEEPPAALEQNNTEAAHPGPLYDQDRHGIAQQPWNANAPVYDGGASLAADAHPSHFTEASYAIPAEPEAAGELGAVAPPPPGTQNFTVAFTVQGSGTICVNAPTGQDAIEQLQYNTSLQGGLAGLLSYAKCATMFQVIE